MLTLSGHSEVVYAAAITPDGQRAVSGSYDETVRVWDLNQGKNIFTLSGHSGSVESVSIAPDGRHAVSADVTLRMWDLEQGRELGALSGHSTDITSVAITPDGRHAISGSQDMTVRVWDLERGTELCTFSGHYRWVHTVAVAPGGRRAISGSQDKTLRMWDLKTGQEVGRYFGDAAVLSCSVSTNGKVVTAGDALGGVHIVMPRKLALKEPLVTPVRLWLYGPAGNPGRWDDTLTAVCPICGKRFEVAEDILETIATLQRTSGFNPGRASALDLAHKAWQEPQLLSKCPQCREPLRFNPFLVDNQGRWGDSGSTNKQIRPTW